MARTRLYRDGNLILENFPVADISDHLVEPDAVVWLDLCEPEEPELGVISEEFGLHALAVEDAHHAGQRPKLDRYTSHLFISAHSVRFDAVTCALSTSEVAVFVTPQALITVRKSPDFDIRPVMSRWDASPDLAKHGVGFLLHGLLDVIVDGHFDTVQQLDDAVDELEDALFDPKPRDRYIQRRSFELRKSLMLLRRVALPMREILNALMRRDLHVVDEAMMPYYQDVYDHVLRVGEWSDSLRDLVTTILDTNLTIQSNRMNLIMKKVTSWAAIIAIPTAVTGFYGQNVPYPGFGATWGFALSSGIIVVGSLLLYGIFRWRDWL